MRSRASSSRRVSELNNNWWCEAIRAATCGEQPLPPYGSCLLGSVNLTCFVEQPFGDEARFDWDRFREVVRVFTRMLDNVVEINGLPLEQQAPRHACFLGLGSTLTLLQAALRRSVLHRGSGAGNGLVGWGSGLELARGEGPGADPQDYEVTRKCFKRPEMAADGWPATASAAACFTPSIPATCNGSPNMLRN